MFKQTINILKVNMLASTLHRRGYAIFGIPALHGRFSGTFLLNGGYKWIVLLRNLTLAFFLAINIANTDQIYGPTKNGSFQNFNSQFTII